jgi:hypothetical protein
MDARRLALYGELLADEPLDFEAMLFLWASNCRVWISTPQSNTIQI